MPKAGLKLKSKNDFTLKRGNVENLEIINWNVR
jgi:hypothetical protein